MHKQQQSLPTVSMARSEACATILEDIVLQMQTIMEGDTVVVAGEAAEAAEATEAEASDKEMVLLFVVSAVTGDVILRSQIIAGKSTRQDTMLIVIRFITNLKNKKTKHTGTGDY